MANRRSQRSSNSDMGTAAHTGTVSDYLTPASETVAHQVVGHLWDKVNILGKDVKELHRDYLDDDLRERATVKARSSVPTLLSELAEVRGMAWIDIAALVGVSVSAVRKWRTGGDASPASRLLLAQLAGFLDLLSEYAVEDPAQWMEMPLSLPPGHLIRPVDLYKAGYTTELLDIASLRRNTEHVLDDIRPDWRSQASPFEVYDDTDGQKSIRPRQG